MSNKTENLNTSKERVDAGDISGKAQSDGWEELYRATSDLMDSFTATGPKFDRVRDALKAIHNEQVEFPNK